jgi:hypothetical protein
MTVSRQKFSSITFISLSLLICLLQIPILHGTFFALLIAVTLQLYLPGYILARVLGRSNLPHPISRFVWILACGLALSIVLGGIARILSLSIPVYLVVLHGAMLVLVFLPHQSIPKSTILWKLTRKNILLYVLVALSCIVALGVSYESRNRFYGFEDQSIFISLADWITTHPEVRPQGTPIRSRQVGVVNGDVRMEVDGWTYTQASWVWTSGVTASQLVWYDLATLFVWTIPLIHFALAYELTKREEASAWTAVGLTLAGLLTLDNIVYNPGYTAYGRFALFQINVNRQASIAFILPLALTAGVAYLGTLAKRDLAFTALLGLALSLMHPIPTTILVFSLGVTAFLNWLTEPTLRRLRRFVPLAVLLLLLIALPFIQRVSFFGLGVAPSLTNDVSTNVTSVMPLTHIILLPNFPLLGTTYIRRPESVFYSPAILISVVIGLLVGLRWRRNLALQYVFGTTLLGMILFFTPGITSFIDKFGSFITLLVLMFMLPVSLALGLGLEFIINRLKLTVGQYAQPIVGLTVVVLVFTLLFEPFPISGSSRDQLRAYNDMQSLRRIHPSQAALIDSLKEYIPPNAITVLVTPYDVANLIIEDVHGTLVTGGRDGGINTSAQGNNRFFTETNPPAPWLDSIDLNFLAEFGVTHIITLADTTRLTQMRLLPNRFVPLSNPQGYTVFQVQSGILSDHVDDLYTSMNELYATVNRPRWGRDGFNLNLPGNVVLWQPIAKEWETLLAGSPNDERVLLGLAYTYVMMGKDELALPLWSTLYKQYPNEPLYADAIASIGQSINPLENSIATLIGSLASDEPATRVLAARRLLTETFFYRLSSDQLNQIIAITEQNAIMWDRLANFDSADKIRSRAALVLGVGLGEIANTWLDAIPRVQRSPEDLVTQASVLLAQGDSNTALFLLRPATDSDWLTANRSIYPDRWENNTAAQTYYLLLGSLAQREQRYSDAEVAFQQAIQAGATIAGNVFLAELLSSEQIERAQEMTKTAELAWAMGHNIPMPEFEPQLTILDTGSLYVMKPSISRDRTEDSLIIRAVFGNSRPRNTYPIQSWRIQIISTDSSFKYAEKEISAYFADGALTAATTTLSIPSDVPELTQALVYIEPRYNNSVTTAPAILPVVLNRPSSVTVPDVADQMDIEFEEGIVLKGYQLTYQNDILQVALYWQSDQPILKDYQIFVHVLNEHGEKIAGQDLAPVNNRYPTSQWRVGATIADPHTLVFENSLTPGRYQVLIGLYSWQDNMRLPITTLDPQVENDTVHVGDFNE